MKQGQVTVDRVFDAFCAYPCDLTDEIACLGAVVHYINQHPGVFGAPVMGSDQEHIVRMVRETLAVLDAEDTVTTRSLGC